ncbi:PRP38-domain-containing protein [Ophiocordyceps camponoti-floridani]|uniref:Pre-mRNA-splicing factor 38 n=1 Tax=Ophiocordyceps camponoti-floridani TaxID=2030778 RepID=A0A8H4VD85_9HYPO|nr:PRP38-domain-containing protein [Ophiocordyceps camponoti-floridani]
MATPPTVAAGARNFLDTRGTKVALAPNGLNPATIMEKAVRDRISNSYFYQEQCFFANEADVVDRVVEYVNFIGGTHGADQKPSPFLCLAFKLLELAPDEDVLETYLSHGGSRFKYLRALACFYVRLTRPAADVYRTLEPFLADRRNPLGDLDSLLEEEDEGEGEGRGEATANVSGCQVYRYARSGERTGRATELINLFVPAHITAQHAKTGHERQFMVCVCYHAPLLVSIPSIGCLLLLSSHFPTYSPPPPTLSLHAP